jgi:ARG/rhodanese/phosphatase superfamily protein
LTDPAPAAVPALRVGAPDVAGPLAVFPVFGPAPTLEFRSFAEAAALGASVVELPSGPSVNDLLVVNPLDVAVLLYEGEEVRGAQQDRTLDVSVLVAAGAELPVPVSCVEAGRWDAGRRTEPFAPAPQAAFPELRRAKSRSARATGRAQQHEVWAMVGEKAVRHGARSDTGALQDVFAARREAVDALSAPISRHDGQIGMVAVIGGDVAVADVVGRADVFAALHGPRRHRSGSAGTRASRGRSRRARC